MEHKKEVFRRIQPSTDNFLSKLGNSYLADYVPNKTSVDKEIEYNEQTVNKYLSNVQDYYKIIQAWDDANRTDENKELDKLREEMKQKLGGFEKNRIISKKLITSMKNELKNGINIEDIIKKASLEITNQHSMNSSFVSNPYYNMEKRDHHNNSSMVNNSQMPTELINNNQSGLANMSNDVNQNQSQSNIIYPNNMSSINQNNSSVNQENAKVPENA